MSDNRPIITFDILKSACRYTGPESEWECDDCCNHDEFTFPGETLFGDNADISVQPCAEDVCPLLKAENK